MTLEQLLVVAFVGLVAGFLASRLASGHGYGVVGDIVVGVIGALIGAFILGAFITDHVLAPLGVAAGSLIAQIIVASIGAVILLAVLRLFAGSGLRRASPRWASLARAARVWAPLLWTPLFWPPRVTDHPRILPRRRPGVRIEPIRPPFAAPVPMNGAASIRLPVPVQARAC
jgi:uncharacterized membrane protein YeaQ/YmgE (transglycosylase-associated protein family)